MEFRICKADGIANPGEKCFEGNVLKNEQGVSQFQVPESRHELLKIQPWKLKTALYDNLGIGSTGPVIKDVQMFIYKMVLPQQLTCEHCIFQVIQQVLRSFLDRLILML